MTIKPAPNFKKTSVFGAAFIAGYFTTINIYKLPSGYSRRLFVSIANKNQIEISLNN